MHICVLLAGTCASYFCCLVDVIWIIFRLCRQSKIFRPVSRWLRAFHFCLAFNLKPEDKTLDLNLELFNYFMMSWSPGKSRQISNLPGLEFKILEEQYFSTVFLDILLSALNYFICLIFIMRKQRAIYLFAKNIKIESYNIYWKLTCSAIYWEKDFIIILKHILSGFVARPSHILWQMV